MTTFADLGLSASILKALDALNFTTPTPIQEKAIPHVMAGRDIMGLAQTGTGKTAAFGLPLLNRILDIGHPPKPRRVRALIMAPTRELVTQIADNLKLFTKGTPVKVLTVIGGASVNKQHEALARGTDVLVATPGRLIDLLERQSLTLEDTGYLVLDEADQMLDMGFIHLLRKIARYLPHRRQTLMFSATMPKMMDEIAEAYLRDPIKVAANPPGKTADRIEQAVHFTSQGDKAKLLETYLKQHPGEAALVFGRTKHGSEKLMKLLVSWGFNAGSIHGNKSQNHRDRTLTSFRSGELDVLVATDVAARGIDIPLVRHVYNFDMPNVADNYVHRIGRTARAGASGKAVAFCAPAEMEELRAIEQVTGEELPVIGGQPWPEDNRGKHAPRRPGQQNPHGKMQGKPQNRKPRPAAGEGARFEGPRSEGPRSEGPRGERPARGAAAQDRRFDAKGPSRSSAGEGGARRSGEAKPQRSGGQQSRGPGGSAGANRPPRRRTGPGRASD